MKFKATIISLSQTSSGLTIPKKDLERSKYKEGDRVNVSIEEDQ